MQASSCVSAAAANKQEQTFTSVQCGTVAKRDIVTGSDSRRSTMQTGGRVLLLVVGMVAVIGYISFYYSDRLVIYVANSPTTNIAKTSSFLQRITDGLRIFSKNYTTVPHSQGNLTVVCMILTRPDTWETRARAVRNTWAKRCHIPIFFYSRSAADIRKHRIVNATNTVGLDVPEGRNHLTAKTRASLQYSLEKYGDVADWFLKADDDTYIIWENFESLLGQHNSSVPMYLGRRFMTHMPHGYTSGGAGYVVSKSAAQLLLFEGPKKFPTNCPLDGGLEDVHIGLCLSQFSVYPANTTDTDLKHRFNSDNPIPLLDGNKQHTAIYFATWDNLEFGNRALKKNDQVMSHDSVSFHYISPGTMYMFEFLLYRLNRRLPLAPIQHESVGNPR